MNPLYSVDASALLHAYARAYPPSVMMFRPVWALFAHLVDSGILRASIEVLTEIRRKDDDLTAWCEDHPDLFVEIQDDEFQLRVGAILGEYPKLVDTGKGKGFADPFVIALAESYNPPLTVVTQEEGGKTDKPRIPFICQQRNIRRINLLELITEQST